ncbi:MAG TPA: hypothetical protein PK526_02665 [bacterium]|nr:hypothetical protein [bacterium]
MTTDQIKNQITAYVRKFKENSGMFKSFEVISDYVDFLESEPYLKELLTPIISYIKTRVFEVGQAENIIRVKFIKSSVSLSIVELWKKTAKNI